MIGPGARLGQYCTLGRNVRIGDNAVLQRSVVHDNTYLGSGVRIDGSVLGRGSDLRQGVRCEEGVVLGDQCFVGAHAEIKAGVKVYPFKTVEAGATVNSSIVWESMGARSLFGRDGVQGLANVDISPELAVRLSMAWASTFEKGATVTTSRDTSRAARVLKRAIMVGCNAAGINVDDLEAATVPVTRFQVTSSDSMAGVTVRLAPDDPQSVVLRFFDKEGIDVDETTQRKIERLYHREDFRRVLAREIGDIDFPPRSLEHYTAALIDSVDLSNARQADLKLVLDYSFGTSSFVMPNLLAKLEAEVLVVNPYANTAGVLAFDRQASAARVSELVRASGAHLGAVLDPGRRARGHRRRPGPPPHRRRGPAGPVDPGHRGQPLGPGGPAGGGQRGGRGDLPEGRRRDRLDQALGLPPDGGGPHRAGHPGRQPVGWVHLPGLPPRLRRRRHPGQPAGPPHRLGPQAVRAGGRAPRRPHRPPGGRTPRGTRRAWSCGPWWSGSVDRELVLVDGVKVLETDGWALVLPDPEEPLTHVWAEAASDAQAEARANEYAVRLEQLLR